LNGELFYTLQEAKILIETLRRQYNAVRPHSSLGYHPGAPEVPRESCINCVEGDYLPGLANLEGMKSRKINASTLVTKLDLVAGTGFGRQSWPVAIAC
jgi:hypothetical protein